jgi:hypothetical protein
MTPVAAKEHDWVTLNFSAGRRKSFRPAITKLCNKKVIFMCLSNHNYDKFYLTHARYGFGLGRHYSLIILVIG